MTASEFDAARGLVRAALGMATESRAEVEAEAAEAVRFQHRLIRDAYALKVSPSELVKITGLSRQRIHEITKAGAA